MRILLLDLRRAILVTRTILPLVLSVLRQRVSGEKSDLPKIGVRLREALQSLGVTYIKLGQFLAMRFDIIPEEVCRELARLFDEVPPMPSTTVRRILEQEFSRPVEQLFSQFEWSCVAAASVAQVHQAVTHDGRVVAVKVQRPRITELFAADMRFLGLLARMADKLELLGPQPIAEVLEEFQVYTQLEMDFVVEGRTADRLRANAGEYEAIPGIVWALTTSRVLTMDFMEGFPLSQIIKYVESGRVAELKRIAPDLDLELAVHNFARACLRQLFQTGFFHADPHPGNIILRGDGTVVFVDFGIFGQLTPKQMENVAAYIESLAIGNIPQSYRHFLQLLQTTSETDFDQLRRDIYAMMLGWYEASRDPATPVSERHIGKYINEFIGVVRRNRVRMSYGLILFWRALMTLDATALRFQQQFDLLSELQSFFAATRSAGLERHLGPAVLGRWVLTIERTIRECPSRLLRSVPKQDEQNILIEATVSSGVTHQHPRPDFAKGLAMALCSLSLMLLVASPLVSTGWGLAIWALVTMAALQPFQWRRDQR